MCLTQALSRRPFSPAQSQVVEELTHDGRNLIEKYIAGTSRYELTRSRYGQRNVSTVASPLLRKSVQFLNDSGILSWKT